MTCPALVPLAVCAALGGDPVMAGGFRAPPVSASMAFTAPSPRHRRHPIECRIAKTGRDYWRWRLIDGRRCWFEGRRQVAKAALFWRRATPSNAPPAVDPVVLNIQQPTVVRTITIRPSFDELWNARSGQ